MTDFDTAVVTGVLWGVIVVLYSVLLGCVIYGIWFA